MPAGHVQLVVLHPRSCPIAVLHVLAVTLAGWVGHVLCRRGLAGAVKVVIWSCADAWATAQQSCRAGVCLLSCKVCWVMPVALDTCVGAVLTAAASCAACVTAGICRRGAGQREAHPLGRALCVLGAIDWACQGGAEVSCCGPGEADTATRHCCCCSAVHLSKCFHPHSCCCHSSGAPLCCCWGMQALCCPGQVLSCDNMSTERGTSVSINISGMNAVPAAHKSPCNMPAVLRSLDTASVQLLMKHCSTATTALCWQLIQTYIGR